MNRIVMMIIAIAVTSGGVNALELEKISLKDVAKLTRETQTVVPEPQKSITPDMVAKAAKPITAPVDLKSPAFAELLINSLNVQPKKVLMAGGHGYIYEVGAGLTCFKSFALTAPPNSQAGKARYACAINPAGGWKFMGMESYGSGGNREFSKALYAALKVKEKNDEGIKTRTLELDQPDSDGGTERNQLHCINPSPELELMGLRPTCQLINAL